METITFSGGLALLMIIVAVAHGYLSRRHEIFGYYNMFLLGMMTFYAVPMILIPILQDRLAPEFARLGVTDGAWRVVSAGLIIFMIFFFIGGRLARNWRWVDKIVPKIESPATSSGVFISIAVYGGLLGVIQVLGIEDLGFWESLLFQLRPSFICFVAGLCVLLAVAYPKNPTFLAIAVMAVVGGLVLSTTFSSDRRFPLGVLMIAGWVAYYYWLRRESRIKTIAILGSLAVFALVFVFIYNTIRHQYTVRESTLADRINQLQSADQGEALREDNILRTFVQDTAHNTGWLVDHFPSDNALKPLHGLAYLLVNPIPRALWADKPVAIGILMQEQTRAYGNLGPGVIGHGWAEAMWIGIIYYAVFFGAFTVIVDRLIVWRLHNPYFCIAVGSSLGNVLGLPRGETALFLAFVLSAIVAIWLIQWSLTLVAKPFMIATPPLPLMWMTDEEIAEAEAAAEAAPATEHSAEDQRAYEAGEFEDAQNDDGGGGTGRPAGA